MVCINNRFKKILDLEAVVYEIASKRILIYF